MHDASRPTTMAMLLVSLLAGCSAPALRPPRAGPAEPPAGAPPAALRASFTGHLDLGSGSRRFEGALALEAPDRLYVELAGPVGGVRAVLAARGPRVVVLFPGTKEFIDEEATAATFESLLGLRLDTGSLIDLIRLGGDASCGPAPCTRRMLMAPDAGGLSRVLVVSRLDGRLSARIEEGAAEPDGFRSLELRLRDAESPGPGEIAGALFTPDVPEGWTRVRPQACPACGALLRTR